MTIHPKAAEAIQRADARRRNRNIYKAAIKRAQADGVRFLVIGNLTIAYKVDRRDVINLSTSLKNPSDKTDVLFGKFTAFERFEMFNYIQIKRPAHPHYRPTIKDFLQDTFHSQNAKSDFPY
jgi:hypothetical protein